jgi:hypothetical protein
MLSGGHRRQAMPAVETSLPLSARDFAYGCVAVSLLSVMPHKFLKIVLVLTAICIALGVWKVLRDRSAYTLTSYKKQGETETISLCHEGHTIRADCSSSCDEFGTMVGQPLFCFTEPAPSDSSRPYGTKRPIFDTTGGSFVCRTDGGTGPLFLTRNYKCLPEASVSDYEKQLRNQYPEDALYVSSGELDKRYCRAGETLIDQGGDIITSEGKVLPTVPRGHSELLKIVEAR